MSYIMHVDIDAFFPSVEKILHPEYKNLPLAVGVNAKRSIVSSVCYVARSYGVKSAMPIFMALELCPNIVFSVSPMHVYQDWSNKFLTLLKQNTPGKVQIGSIDEAYISLNGSIKTHAKAARIAKELQDLVEEKLGLSISFGISKNRFLAKMATSLKKPHGISWIYKDEVKDKLWPLKIEDFFGIGRTKHQKLHQFGVYTIGDFAAKPIDDKQMNKLFVNQYLLFRQKAYGYETKEDELLEERIETKSVGASRTLMIKDIEKINQAYELLEKLLDQCMIKIKKFNYFATAVTIQIRTDADVKLKNYQTSSKTPSNNRNDWFKIIWDLFLKHWNELPIRQLGINFPNVKKISAADRYISIYDKVEIDSNNKILKIINDVNEILDEKVLFLASDINDNN